MTRIAKAMLLRTARNIRACDSGGFAAVRVLCFLMVWIGLLVGCESPPPQLQSFLPSAPPGWHVMGTVVSNGTPGRFRTWIKSYTPESSTDELGVGRVVVHLHFVEKPRDYNEFWQDLIKDLAGPFHSAASQDYPFYESPPTSNQEFHLLVVDLGGGRYVEMTAWRGGSGWEMGSKNPGTVISTFLHAMDLKGISTAKSSISFD